MEIHTLHRQSTTCLTIFTSSKKTTPCHRGKNHFELIKIFHYLTHRSFSYIFLKVMLFLLLNTCVVCQPFKNNIYMGWNEEYPCLSELVLILVTWTI